MRTLTLCLALTAGVAAGVVPADLPWTQNPEETLHFDTVNYGGFAVLGEYEYYAGVRFTPERPCTVRAVIFYQYDVSAEDGKVYVYGQNSRARPGELLALGSYPRAGTRCWKRVELNRPAAVDSGVDFWTCVTTTYYTGDHPLGVDRGPLLRYRGGYINVPLMGETWYQLSDPPFYVSRNWNQRAIVVSCSGIEEELGPGEPVWSMPVATVVRGVLRLRDCHPVSAEETGGGTQSVLLDAAGRKVLDLIPGANDVSRQAPGVYLVRSEPSAASREPLAVSVRRVVITR